MKKSSRLIQISLFISLAISLQITETFFFPMFLPWGRLGIANIITLIAIFSLGPKEGIFVTFLRSLLTSLLLGSFFGPTFLIGFAGSLAGAMVMASSFKLFRDRIVNGGFYLNVSGCEEIQNKGRS